jgi:hypothetical protein
VLARTRSRTKPPPLSESTTYEGVHGIHSMRCSSRSCWERERCVPCTIPNAGASFGNVCITASNDLADCTSSFQNRAANTDFIAAGSSLPPAPSLSLSLSLSTVSLSAIDNNCGSD